MEGEAEGWLGVREDYRGVIAGMVKGCDLLASSVGALALRMAGEVPRSE